MKEQDSAPQTQMCSAVLGTMDYPANPEVFRAPVKSFDTQEHLQ